MRSAGESADRFATAFLVVVIALAPWPLGSRLPWAAMSLAAAVLLVAALWSARAIVSERPLVRSPLYAPVLTFLAWSGLQWLAGWTVYADATAYEWVRYLSYAATFFLALQVAGRPAGRSLLARTIVITTLLVGAFGIVQALSWNGLLYWVYEPPYAGVRFGPFNNRNYFAGYMLVGLGLAAATTMLEGDAKKRRLMAAGTMVGIVAIAVSLSRAGILTLAFQLGLVAWLIRRGRGGDDPGARPKHHSAAATDRDDDRRRPEPLGRQAMWTPARVAVAAALAVLIVLIALGQLDPVMTRLESIVGLGDEAALGGRVLRWQESLPMLAQRPIVGFGLNTYGWAYAAFHANAGYSMHAHNEYLEMAIETGLIGAAICVWFLVVLLRSMWRRLQEADSPHRGVIAGVGAISGWMAILLYSMTDFPTIIPAINYSLAVLAALGTMERGQPAGAR